MRTGIVAFLIGNTCLLYGSYLPDNVSILLLCGFLCVLTLIVYKSPQHLNSLPLRKRYLYIPVLCFFSGILYTSLYITQFVYVLDLGQKEGKTIRVMGTISSIPYQTSKKQGFEFLINALEKKDESGNKQWDESFHGKVRLSWYSKKQSLENGQKWQLDIRLKKPNGLMNPGGFDYEQWLYQNRIAATGYVRGGSEIYPEDSDSTQSLLVKMRQEVAHRLDSALINHPYKGLIKALAIGVRHDIEPEQWQTFLRTGTNHLVAISGLHIGLMSSLMWFVVYTLWRASSILNKRIPACYIASGAALISAFIYAALAGFAIPTQRALIMLSVVFGALILKREFAPSYVLLLALLMVLLVDPLSSLSPGFWLSFSAVGIILFALTARLNFNTSRLTKLLQLTRLQAAIFTGLMPLMILLFNQFSLVSPLANLLAVPFMSIIIVPAILFATAGLFIFEPAGLFLFKMLELPMNGMISTLSWFSQWSESLYSLAQTSWPMLMLAFIGCIWLIMPKGWQGRWLGVFLLLPAFMAQEEKIPEGQVQMTVLDVGQGLSLVVQTKNHNLIFDTGDKYNERMNMADMVIIPFLRAKGIKAIDKLVVSHSDRDHAGSYAELLNNMSIDEVMSGEPEKINVKASSNPAKNLLNTKIQAEQCFQGQQWQWDNVDFKVLSPQWPGIDKAGNNRSCVILITTAAKQTFLLTGDIENKIEKQIVKLYPDLKVDVLVVPHHGSKTSSGRTFLSRLKPEIALFSYGYRNRFRHPAKKVVHRYKDLNIKLYNTSNGAIEIRSNITNNSFLVQQYRIENRRFWHRVPEYL